MGKSGIFLSFGGYSEHVARFFSTLSSGYFVADCNAKFPKTFYFYMCIEIL